MFFYQEKRARWGRGNSRATARELSVTISTCAPLKYTRKIGKVQLNLGYNGKSKARNPGPVKISEMRIIPAKAYKNVVFAETGVLFLFLKKSM